MYTSFYGLRERPFSLLPDPGYLYPGTKHERALTMLRYALVNQAGFSVICGDIGAGKTTLIRCLLNELGDDTTIGLISNTHQSFGELLQWVLMAFGLPATGQSKVEMHERFVDFVIERYAKGSRTLLIVDEAQNMTVDQLEELRMLSNINADKDQVLQLMLSGQPGLRDLLRRPELAQFVQRITVDYYLESLNEAETQGYIEHRMRVAGAGEPVFTSAACSVVHRYSGGTPRLINLLCDTALVYGFAEQTRTIDAPLIDAVVADRRRHGILPVFASAPSAVPAAQSDVAPQPPPENEAGPEPAAIDPSLRTRWADVRPASAVPHGFERGAEADMPAATVTHLTPVGPGAPPGVAAAIESDVEPERCYDRPGPIADAPVEVPALAGSGEDAEPAHCDERPNPIAEASMEVPALAGSGEDAEPAHCDERPDPIGDAPVEVPALAGSGEDAEPVHCDERPDPIAEASMEAAALAGSGEDAEPVHCDERPDPIADAHAAASEFLESISDEETERLLRAIDSLAGTDTPSSTADVADGADRTEQSVLDEPVLFVGEPSVDAHKPAPPDSVDAADPDGLHADDRVGLWLTAIEGDAVAHEPAPEAGERIAAASQPDATDSAVARAMAKFADAPDVRTWLDEVDKAGSAPLDDSTPASVPDAADAAPPGERPGIEPALETAGDADPIVPAGSQDTPVAPLPAARPLRHHPVLTSVDRPGRAIGGGWLVAVSAVLLVAAFTGLSVAWTYYKRGPSLPASIMSVMPRDTAEQEALRQERDALDARLRAIETERESDSARIDRLQRERDAALDEARQHRQSLEDEQRAAQMLEVRQRAATQEAERTRKAERQARLKAARAEERERAARAQAEQARAAAEAARLETERLAAEQRALEQEQERERTARAAAEALPVATALAVEAEPVAVTPPPPEPKPSGDTAKRASEAPFTANPCNSPSARFLSTCR